MLDGYSFSGFSAGVYIQVSEIHPDSGIMMHKTGTFVSWSKTRSHNKFDENLSIS